MGNPDNLKSVIEKAVADVLTQVIPGLRDQIAQLDRRLTPDIIA